MKPSTRVIDAQLQDYFSARESAVSAIGNQHMALTFGTAALVAAFGAGFFAWDRPLATAIFLGVVPLSWWILTMWLGEVVRMLRAVEFCVEQEQLINSAIRADDPSLPDGVRWEQWRGEDSSRTIVWTYSSVAFLLLFTNAAAMACATITAANDGWRPWVIALVWVITSLAGLVFVGWVLTKFQAWATPSVGTPDSRFLRIFLTLPLRGERGGSA